MLKEKSRTDGNKYNLKVFFHLVHYKDCPVLWDTSHPTVFSGGYCMIQILQDKRTGTGRKPLHHRP